MQQEGLSLHLPNPWKAHAMDMIMQCAAVTYQRLRIITSESIELLNHVKVSVEGTLRSHIPICRNVALLGR
jgi:hypothetical protein